MSVRFEFGRPGPAPRGPSQLLSFAAHGLAGAVVLTAPVLAPATLPEPRNAELRPLPPPDLPRVVVARTRESGPARSAPARPAAVPAAGPPAAPAAPPRVPQAGALAALAERMLGATDPTFDGVSGLGIAGGVPGGGMPGGVPAGSGPGPAGGPGEPARAGVDVEPPVRLSGALPQYPELARRIRLEGDVELECVIDESGAVRDARVVSGPTMFHQAALTAVTGWRYAPTRLRGHPVAVRLRVVVRFELS